MEVESLHSTVEDLLRLHRDWITKLFVDDFKTEVEIVQLLSQRHLFITPLQLRRCLQDWDLQPAQGSSLSPQLELGSEVQQASINSPRPRIETKSVSESWEIVNPQSQTLSCSQLSATSDTCFFPDSPTYTPSSVTVNFDDRETISRYEERPLPSLPATSKQKRKPSTSLVRPKRDKLKLTYHHGDEFHPVEMTLGILGEGPSPIETYASDDQSHERIAIGLKRDPDHSDRFPTQFFQRADHSSGKRRDHKMQRVRRRDREEKKHC